MTPIRIQRKRTKGWKMPENTVYVGRPTKWGNPFPFHLTSRDEAIQLYADGIYSNDRLREEIVLELSGKNLACFCPLDQPCHADILLKIANP